MTRRGPRAEWAGPLGLHTPGSTWLHRLAPGWKLAGLLSLSVLLMLWREPVVVLASLACVVVLLAVAGVPASVLRTLAPFLVTAGALALFQWWSRDLRTAVVTAGTLLTLVLGAMVVTASTRSDRLLDSLVRAAGPLRHVGLSPHVLAVTIALMLRTIPTLVDLAWDVRDAARARGLDRSPRAHLVPFALRTVARAHTTADALAARGILDDDVDPSVRSTPEGRVP